MRKTLTTYLLSIFSLGLMCQGTIDLESTAIDNIIFAEKSIPIVKGKLSGYSKAKFPELQVRYTVSTLSFRKQTSKTADIEADGSFALTLEYGIPYQEIWVSVGDFYFGKVLAHKPTMLELNLDILNITPVRYLGEGATFSGENSEVNIFLNSFENYKKDKREELLSEKLQILMSQSLPKSEKVIQLQKVYKKLGGIESSFAKKNDRSLQWILTNDRLATMYADLISIHWGSKMNDLLKQECLAFRASVLSNASVQYYDFLSFYLQIPNRIETKLLTERTLRNQLEESTSSADLDRFLREYDKKRDHLRYDKELFVLGEENYLDRYEYELKSARLEMYIKKLSALNQQKATIVSLLAQPKCIKDREIYLDRIEQKGVASWATKIMKKDLLKDKARVSKINGVLVSTNDTVKYSLGIQGVYEDQFLSDASSIEELFANIKGHFSDKAVIIDLWAPWSDQCGRDLDQSAHISGAIDTLPVQMVFLCSGNDVPLEYWQNELQKIPIVGTHIYLNAKLSAEIMEYFQVRNYPTYFFIDQEGHFDPDFIVNLADLKTKKLISKLNIEAKL